MKNNIQRRKFLKTLAITGTLAICAPQSLHANSIISVDSVISKLVAVGIPGLIILSIAATSGLVGGAATIMALSTLGGPFGMMGGIVAVALLAVVIDALAGASFEYIGKKVVEGLIDEGHSEEEIRETVENYPISRGLKLKILELL